MTDPPEIIDLFEIVEPHLNGRKLLTYSSRFLTKIGENYGSLMLSISADLQHPDGKIENLPLVAKLPPLTNEMFWTLFNPSVTALTENAIYLKVSPILRQLQIDSGIPESEIFDVFAKFYGCRISLDDKATVLDRDAVLVLENLQKSGYKPGVRHIMYDYEGIKFVLKHVAKYHALPIVLRQRQPKTFQHEILPNFLRYDMSKQMTPEMDKEFRTQDHDEVKLALGDDVKSFERFKELMTLYYEYMGSSEECQDGLFTTIAHYDMWMNNIMIKYDESGIPNKMKIVDFQLTQYESLMHDLIFLLLSSVETNVVEEHFHELLKYYYNEFIECLKKTSGTTEEYSFDKFMEEMHRIGPVQIYHATFMARILLAEETILPDNHKDIDLSMFKTLPSERLLQRIRDIIRLSQKFGFFW